MHIYIISRYHAVSYLKKLFEEIFWHLHTHKKRQKRNWLYEKFTSQHVAISHSQLLNFRFVIRFHEKIGLNGGE